MLGEARALLTDLLRPLSYDQFFGEIVGQQPFALLGGKRKDRAQLLGTDPRQIILNAYEKHAPELTCHALAPRVQPPSARTVASPDAFHSLIRDYHTNDFTVRIPDAVDLSSELRRLTRALEVIVENTVGAVVFWSGPGAKAPVHHDDIDVMAIQLSGKKRWFISNNPSILPNQWKGVGEPPPALGPHRTVDVEPGDLIYMPRGTAHTVESTTESIHVSIGFVPVTVRDALIAAIDHLSDLDKPIRTGITARADDLARGEVDDTVLHQVSEAVKKLSDNIQSDSFVRDAMSRRRSRLIAEMPKLPSEQRPSAVHLRSRVKHSSLAIAHTIKAGDVIDFSQPGEQIFVHAGAEESLRYIIDTPDFNVADIPGAIDNDVRVALVQRLLKSGFLEVVAESPAVALSSTSSDAVAGSRLAQN